MKDCVARILIWLQRTCQWNADDADPVDWRESFPILYALIRWIHVIRVLF